MANLKCEICGTEFPAIRERHYISRDMTKTGVAAVFQSSDEPMLYDTYDCPNCGSQKVVQSRKYEYVEPCLDDGEDEEEDEKP